jgi:hypothetical protein
MHADAPVGDDPSRPQAIAIDVHFTRPDVAASRSSVMLSTSPIGLRVKTVAPAPMTASLGACPSYGADEKRGSPRGVAPCDAVWDLRTVAPPGHRSRG